ncbi:hypothetical protein SAMN06265339_0167 [Desulfurobacterium pacificum]|uniref:DUF505 domain-containing protein n=1 Tax=Desulfurobacterium pacificum TaxID=240166 RepID=A0ABY1N9A4_9BACT|nr:DUF505 domain-containing protein [Desulfurobacterium pacificum]SMP03978.1 hypothetical protein SAMN06265339_0167 [Desulfurobacterium pacificum]
MVIRKEHAIALLRVREEERNNAPTCQLFAKSEDSPYLELERMNLLRMVRPLEYSLTYWGRALANIIDEMVEKGLIEHPSKWDDDFRWLGSEVIMMIETAIENDDLPGYLTEKELEKRGFIEERKVEKKGTFKAINQYAKDIYSIFQNAHPRLIIDRELYEYIKKMPSGPAESSELPAGGRFPIMLGAMRLLAFSVPNSDVYSLTTLGQEIKKACETIAPSLETVISEDIMDSLERAVFEGFDAISDEEKEVLFELALIDDEGNPLPAGEHLINAYRIWKERSFKPVKSINVEILDAEILKGIEEVWKHHESDPSVMPTVDEIVHYLFYKPLKEYKHLIQHYGRRLYQDLGYQKKEEIMKKFSEVKTVEELFKSFYEKGNRWYEKMYDIVQESLYTLESFNLVRAEEKEGKKVHYLTDFGKKVLEDMKTRGFREIPATAVKAITITNKEFAAPNIDWYRKGVETQLIGGGEPTVAGKMYAQMAYEIKRLPHVTRFELQVLHKLPERGFFVKDVYEQFDETWQEEIEYALNKLEARGYIDILQNEAIILTEPGKLIKKALSGTPEGFANPITPLAVRVLAALREVGTLYEKERKVRILPKNFEKAVKLSGLDPETFERELVILRASNLVGKNSINEAGLLILEALDKLN